MSFTGLRPLHDIPQHSNDPNDNSFRLQSLADLQRQGLLHLNSQGNYEIPDVIQPMQQEYAQVACETSQGLNCLRDQIQYTPPSSPTESPTTSNLAIAPQTYGASPTPSLQPRITPPSGPSSNAPQFGNIADAGAVYSQDVSETPAQFGSVFTGLPAGGEWSGDAPNARYLTYSGDRFYIVQNTVTKQYTLQHQSVDASGAFRIVASEKQPDDIVRNIHDILSPEPVTPQEDTTTTSQGSLQGKSMRPIEQPEETSEDLLTQLDITQDELDTWLGDGSRSIKIARTSEAASSEPYVQVSKVVGDITVTGRLTYFDNTYYVNYSTNIQGKYSPLFYIDSAGAVPHSAVIGNKDMIASAFDRLQDIANATLPEDDDFGTTIASLGDANNSLTNPTRGLVYEMRDNEGVVLPMIVYDLGGALNTKLYIVRSEESFMLFAYNNTMTRLQPISSVADDQLVNEIQVYIESIRDDESHSHSRDRAGDGLAHPISSTPIAIPAVSAYAHINASADAEAKGALTPEQQLNSQLQEKFSVDLQDIKNVLPEGSRDSVIITIEDQDTENPYIRIAWPVDEQPQVYGGIRNNNGQLELNWRVEVGSEVRFISVGPNIRHRRFFLENNGLGELAPGLNDLWNIHNQPLPHHDDNTTSAIESAFTSNNYGINNTDKQYFYIQPNESADAGDQGGILPRRRVDINNSPWIEGFQFIQHDGGINIWLVANNRASYLTDVSSIEEIERIIDFTSVLTQRTEDSDVLYSDQLQALLEITAVGENMGDTVADVLQHLGLTHENIGPLENERVLQHVNYVDENSPDQGVDFTFSKDSKDDVVIRVIPLDNHLYKVLMPDGEGGSDNATTYSSINKNIMLHIFNIILEHKNVD